jgi:hypothetical protein
MPATVLAERVGWTGSITWFRRTCAAAAGAPAVDPADRLVWAPGDAAQCDCGSRRSGSRWRTAPRRVAGVGDHRGALAVHARADDPDPQTEDLLLGSWSLIEQLGRVPRRLIWDNESGIGRGNAARAGVAAFCGTLATRHGAAANDPESKGIVERRNGFFETSFMPGRSSTRPATSTPSSPTGWPRREPAGGAHDQGPPARSARRGPGRDAGVAAGPAAPGLAQPDPARPGLLRAPRHQRLLRRPDRDRPACRRDRRPAPGPGPRSTGASSPTTPGSGPAG